MNQNTSSLPINETKNELYPNRFFDVFCKEYMNPMGLSIASLAAKIGYREEHLQNWLNNGRGMSRIVSSRLDSFFGKPNLFFYNLQDELDEPYRTVSVTMDIRETRRLLDSLDIYSRIFIGQYDSIPNKRMMLLPVEKWQTYQNVKEEIMNTLMQIRHIVLPELDGYGVSGSWGIWNPKVNPKAVDAYDMKQVIRHAVAYYQHPEGGITCDFNEPMIRGRYPRTMCHVSGDVGSPKVLLELVPEQKAICDEAMQVYEYLAVGNYHALFTYYTNKQAALDKADWCTKLEIFG